MMLKPTVNICIREDNNLQIDIKRLKMNNFVKLDKINCIVATLYLASEYVK